MSQAPCDLSSREFRGSERVSNFSQDELLLYQNEFLSECDIDRHEPKRRKKKAKRPWSVKSQRQSAYKHIRALDKQMHLTIGSGLVAFKSQKDDLSNVAMRM